MGLMEFLSLPGQERTRRRDEFLGGLLNYYLGPTGIPERLGVMDMMNPVSDVGRSMTSSQEMLAPGRTPEERFNAGVSMLTDIASVAAPGVATRMAGGDEAAALAESLLGFGGQTRQGLDEATRRFLADESGALNLDLLRSRYPDAKIDVSGNPSRGYVVNRIEVPEAARGQGTGTAIMDDILRQADVDGATVALTPSGDFGGNVSRLRQFYEGLGFTPNRGRNRDFGISEEMYRLPQAPVDPATARADEVLGLLRSGRASEVTDDMLDLGDPVLNARLNMYLFDNYDLPMDEASRAAREQEMRFNWALHGTGSNISAVDPSFFGSGRDALGSGFYTTTNAQRANVYAPKVRGPSIESPKEFVEGANVMPLAVRMDRPFDLSEATGRAADEIGEAASQDPYFTYQPRVSGAYIQGDESQSAFIDPYHPRFQTLQRLREGFGPQLTSSLLSDAGYSGIVGHEAAGNLVRVSFNPEDIRSRFARFDPRLAHLRNLSAGVGGLGLLAIPQEEQ